MMFDIIDAEQGILTINAYCTYIY